MTPTTWITNLPVSGDAVATSAAPFTPSAGDLWHTPGVNGLGFPDGR